MPGLGWAGGAIVAPEPEGLVVSWGLVDIFCYFLSQDMLTSTFDFDKVVMNRKSSLEILVWKSRIYVFHIRRNLKSTKPLLPRFYYLRLS